MKELNDYQKAQLAWVNLVGLKNGDTVKVLYLPESRELEWGYMVTPRMGNLAGQECEVIDTSYNESSAIRVNYITTCGHNDNCLLPFFCLQKVKIPTVTVKLSESYDAVIDKNTKTVTVGCQVIPFEAVEKVCAAMK